MSAPPDAPADTVLEPPPTPARRRPGRRTVAVAVAIVIAAQAAWLGALMARGWYYQDDLAFLAQATGRALGPGYLFDRVNDHLSPGLRLVFWLFHPLGASAHWVTIAVRLVLQAAATLLLYRLMVRLVGARWLCVAVLAGYAFTPLLLGMFWFTVAAMVLPAQVLVLSGLLAQVRFVRTGRLPLAAGAGLAFGAAACFLELSAINAVLVVPLTLGFVYTGGLRERVGAMARQWLGWTLAALPLAAFVVAYVAGGYGSSAHTISGSTLLRFMWQEWSDTVAPSALGGPWRWFHSADTYVSATDPTQGAVWLVQAVVVVAVLASLYRTGLQALVAWSLPVIFVVLASTILTIGRFSEFGFLSAHVIVYPFSAALPCALTVVLAFARTHPRRRAAGSRRAARPTVARRWLPPLLVVGVLASAAVSALGFTHRWAQNPTERYLTTLRSELRDHPGVQLFDTPLPTRVLPYIQPDRYLSDIVPLLHEHPSFDAHARAKMIDDRGRVAAVGFLPAARVDPGPTGTFCNHLLRGMTAERYSLSGRANSNEWFLRLEYFQQHPSVIHVWLVDTRGRSVAPVGGSRILLGSTLDDSYLRFPTATPAAVRVESQSPGTNVCLTAIEVGYPFPRKAGQ